MSLPGEGGAQLARRIEELQLTHDRWVRACLRHAQQQAQHEEGVHAADGGKAGRYAAPGHHEGGEPAAGADGHASHLGWDLGQVAGKEQACR